MKEVCRSSETARSSMSSKGLVPRSAATSPSVRPTRGWFAGEKASETFIASQLATDWNTPGSGESAPFASRARIAGFWRARRRSGIGRPKRDAQPGSASSTIPFRKFRRRSIARTSVSATTRAPRPEAWSDAASCPSCRAAERESTCSAFQLRGRPAANDIVGHDLAVFCAEGPHRRNEAERRSGVLTHRTCQSEELFVRREARRHGIAVTVVMGLRARRREAERALLENARAAGGSSRKSGPGWPPRPPPPRP